jgi:hypothetical protein
MKIPPLAQMGIGAIGCLLSLTGAVMAAAHGTVFAWIKAYILFASAGVLAEHVCTLPTRRRTQ